MEYVTTTRVSTTGMLASRSVREMTCAQLLGHCMEVVPSGKCFKTSVLRDWGFGALVRIKQEEIQGDRLNSSLKYSFRKHNFC